MKRVWLTLLLGGTCSACSIFASPIPSLDELRVGSEREPRLVEHTTHNPHTGVLVREWSEWVLPSGRTEKHGRERTWYASGAPEWEREFDHGTPTGHWQGWYEDGTRLAESFHGTDEPTVMSFWHASGELSARGEALNGVRQGEWTHWYENGKVREAGECLAGRKHGEWRLYREDGALEASGMFEHGVRVGRWAGAGR